MSGWWFEEKQERNPYPLILAALGVVGFTGGAEFFRRLFRNSQLFCPEAEPLISWDPRDYGFDPERVEEVRFRADDDTLLTGWYCRAADPIGSGLYCHGNTGNFTKDLAALRRFVDDGLNVLVFDYRGFGRSEGRPTIRGVVRDAHAAAELHERIRPAHLPSLLYGFSLGGAVAAQIVRDHPFDALVLQSTFTNLPEMTRTIFPNLPLHILAGHDFDTLSIVESLEIPLLVIHGTADEMIPCSMGETLHERCATARPIEIIENGMHSDLFDIQGDRIVDVIRNLALDLRSQKADEALGEAS
ncbi:MAG: alpha/beta hydrolase [Thermoanaerobaculia bacterium]